MKGRLVWSLVVKLGVSMLFTRIGLDGSIQLNNTTYFEVVTGMDQGRAHSMMAKATP